MILDRLAAAGLLALLVVPASAALAADGSTAGTATSPYPTVQNLSIEWPFTGDDNGNAVVTVKFRKQGDAAFRDGAPLFRVPGGSLEGFSWASRHAGSLFGLEPGTAYDIELTLGDPDGGSATATLVASTRPIPADPPAPTMKMAAPASLDGVLATAEPGDVILLGDGTYGEIVVPADGAASNPIVIRAANPGMAVVEGDVRIDGRAFVHVEDLVVHGKFKFNDAEWIVVRRNTIETPDDGIVSYGTGVKNAYIADNTITGATVWKESALGVDGDNIGEGVQITGPGNVVAFNRVRGFRDCLSLLEDAEAVNQVADDFYGNDLSECADDAIEADFAMGNVRVYQNRIAQSFMGMSSQPSLGGPTYFLRNVLYNVVFQAFKLQRSSIGDVGLHNTIIKSGDAFSVNTTDVFSRAWFRNNLFLGGPGGTYNGYDSGPGDVMQLPSADEATCSFDYDGYGSTAAAFAGDVGNTSFDSLASLQANTTEKNARQIGLDVFEASIPYPATPFSPAATPKFSLKAGGAAVDGGVVIANVNDGFAGAAPDLGAVELGQPEPVYGPGGTTTNPGTGGASSSSTTSTGASMGTSMGTSMGSGTGSGGADAGGSSGGCDCAIDTRAPNEGAWAASIAAAIAVGARLRSARRRGHARRAP